MSPIGGRGWASVTALPKRGPSWPTRFLERTDPGRQDPADCGPALPTAWGVLGSPGVTKTGHHWSTRVLQPSCQNGVRAHRPVFCNCEMRPGRHQRTLPPRSPRRGECGGARSGICDGRITLIIIIFLNRLVPWTVADVFPRVLIVMCDFCFLVIKLLLPINTSYRKPYSNIKFLPHLTSLFQSTTTPRTDLS